MISRVKSLLVLVGMAPVAAGCAGTGQQSALMPAGIQAVRIHRLWELYLWLCVVVYILVMGFVLAAVFRRGAQGGSDQPLTSPPINQELRKGAIITGALVLTTILLFVFLLGDF